MAIKANKTYFIKRYSSSAYLNIYGNSYTGDTQPIKLWSKVETDPMQKWQFDADPTTGAYLCTMCDLTRAINLYSVNTPNCTIWAKSGNATDGLVKIQEHASGVYYIYLPNRNLYLTANSTSNGTQVTWTSKVSPASITQLWQFEEEESLKVDSSVPSSIVNKIFFIKNKATGRNLNVNGYDTVANSTNVNIYDKEDCLAQRWVAKDTENGPKIFTKIDEDYALNIYNNNCTMYEAEDNDEDSLVIFTTQNAAEKTFRIKMYHHDKYLRAEGDANGSNVGWSDTRDDYSLWQFVDEDSMFPDELTLNRRDFLEKLHDFLGSDFIPSAIIETKANTGYDSGEVEIFNNSLLEIKAKVGYRAGLTNTNSTEYFKNISIEYDRTTDSAELVIGNEYVNISTDLDTFFNNSGKNTNDYLRDIAITLGDGVYSIKFRYIGDTTAAVEIIKNIENLPEKPNLAINASVILTFSFTLKIDFPYRFKNELLSNLNPEFLFIVGFLGIAIFIYWATPIDEIIMTMLASGTVGTIFQVST